MFFPIYITFYLMNWSVTHTGLSPSRVSGRPREEPKDQELFHKHRQLLRKTHPYTKSVVKLNEFFLSFKTQIFIPLLLSTPHPVTMCIMTHVNSFHVFHVFKFILMFKTSLWALNDNNISEMVPRSTFSKPSSATPHQACHLVSFVVIRASRHPPTRLP